MELKNKKSSKNSNSDKESLIFSNKTGPMKRHNYGAIRHNRTKSDMPFSHPRLLEKFIKRVKHLKNKKIVKEEIISELFTSDKESTNKKIQRKIHSQFERIKSFKKVQQNQDEFNTTKKTELGSSSIKKSPDKVFPKIFNKEYNHH